MNTKKLKSYRLDDKTIGVIENIRETIHAESNSEVLRRAITLMHIAATAAEHEEKLILRDKEGGEKEILIL